MVLTAQVKVVLEAGFPGPLKYFQCYDCFLLVNLKFVLIFPFLSVLMVYLKKITYKCHCEKKSVMTLPGSEFRCDWVSKLLNDDLGVVLYEVSCCWLIFSCASSIRSYRKIIKLFYLLNKSNATLPSLLLRLVPRFH